MAEQLNKGVTIPFSSIGTNINKSPTSRVPLDGQNTIVTLTKDTNTTNNREFKSALELAEYDIKVNHSADKLRDTEVYSSSEGEGTHYDRKITLKDLGYYMSERMMRSINKSGETYNINLRSKTIMGAPLEDGNIIDAFDKYAGTDKKAQVNNLNAAGTPPDGFGLDGTYRSSNKNDSYVGKITASEFISKYCNSQSGIAMGEAKVINPDFQFNELDDVRTDYRRPKIGRLYAERIYDYNLPTVYFCPGKVEIKTNLLSLTAAFTRSQTAQLTDYIKDGATNGLKTGIAKMGNLFGSAVSMGSKRILDTAQWYKWTPLTVKYMKYVNEMLIQLAVWMGLINADTSGLLQGWQEELDNFNKEKDNIEKAVEVVNAPFSDDKHKVKFDKNTGVMTVSGYLGGTRNANSNGVLSVLTILPQYTKNKWINSEAFADKNDNNNDDTKDELLPEELFIPFAVCKGISVSESFSNSVGEHPLTNEYNTKYEESNQQAMTLGWNETTLNNIAGQAGEIMNGVSFLNGDGSMDAKSIGSGFLKTGSNALSQNMSKLSGNEIGMVASGAGRFVLPEIWTNSTFDRSYNITFKFRSPYGHRLSIFENTMVPLLFLISLTAPRAIGLSSYTNPFYVKAFSKGLFSCDLGMITSLSISRGEDKNDRTVEGFFRTVTASVSIKDMLPTMQLGLDAGKWPLTNSVNNGMIAYMCNLAGVDFIERANLSKSVDVLLQRLKTDYEDFPANIKAWMASKSAGASVLGLSPKSFGRTSNPMEDRKYSKSY